MISGVPRILFLNKIDRNPAGVRDTLKLLQPVSETPLLLRQIPLRRDGIVVGSIDLALERAYVWREHAESEVTEIPGDEKAREIEARFSMLETLADHDDHLMEQLLDEVAPPQDEVFDDLAADLRDGSVTPVLIGTAEKGNGVLRLLKTIRHDVADVEATRKRLGVAEGAGAIPRFMKTVHTSHGGKLSVSRILSGSVNDGSELDAAGRRYGPRLGHISLARQGPDQADIRQGRRYGRAGQTRGRQDRRYAGFRQERGDSSCSTDARRSLSSRSRCGRRSARTR